MHLLNIIVFASLAIAGPVHVKRAGQVVPGKFIVKLKNNVTIPDSGILPSLGAGNDSVSVGITGIHSTWMAQIQSTLGQNVTTDHVYASKGFKGFSANLDSASIETLKKMDMVDYIVEDFVVSTYDFVTQHDSPWGLSRISIRDPSAFSTSSADYTFDHSAGEGTCVYIIDTGIYTKHTQFGGRAFSVANFSPESSKEDGNGHGTHVSGTIGSRDFGVAKKATLLGVKVLGADGFGTMSGVIAGIDFVATDSRKRRCPNGTVANMSLGGPVNKATNDAIRSAVDAGVFVSVAAGNEAQNSDNTSPASERSAFVVAATDKTDAIAVFSNFGPGVNIFAPGVDILSTWIGTATATKILSGTSMSSPHIAGLAAYVLGLNGKMSPDDLKDEITTMSVRGVVTGITNRMHTVNRFAYNGSPAAGYWRQYHSV